MIKQARERINGITQNIGQTVNIVGVVVQIDPNGRSLTLKTFNDDMINVQLQEPVQNLLKRIIEVHGTMIRNNAVECQRLVNFKEDEFANDTDTELYKEVTSTASKFPTHYITLA